MKIWKNKSAYCTEIIIITAVNVVLVPGGDKTRFFTLLGNLFYKKVLYFIRLALCVTYYSARELVTIATHEYSESKL